MGWDKGFAENTIISCLLPPVFTAKSKHAV